MTDERRESGAETSTHDDTTTTTTGARREVVDREREEHGGIKIGACFFGWLSAMGMAVLLSALIAATGLLAGDATGTDSADEAAAVLDLRVDELGALALVLAGIVWFVAYFSGGYVAGRMARFDGLKQGIGVWLWALLGGIVIGVLGVVAGTDYDASDGMPQVTMGDTTTTAVVVGIVVLALLTLVAAMLGGLAGMRFHRRVDKAGLGR